jgi:hypothetical protein
VQAVDEGAARKAFDLSLPDLGPYSVSFTRSGRWMAIAGDKGHLALMDWSRAHLATEVQVRETTRDVCVLHNEQFFAAAQRKYVYIYDRRGLEVHCCKEHTEPYVLDFLPHHFLLTSAGQSGVPQRSQAAFCVSASSLAVVPRGTVFQGSEHISQSMRVWVKHASWALTSAHHMTATDLKTS